MSTVAPKTDGRRGIPSIRGSGSRLGRLGRRRRLRTTLVVVGLVVVGVIVTAVSWVRLSTRNDVYGVADVPSAPVAIVLGAGLRPDGGPSPWLAARLRDAASLYEAGTVRAILVSGDHGRSDYDEVAAMTEWLVDHDVPAEKVVADHAGFDTYDSCQRAHRVFGVDDAIVVTQDFHLPRALFLCQQAGIRAVGVGSAAHGGRPGMNALREVPASVKAVFDVVLDPGPRYLGPRETGVDDALSD